MPHVSSRVFHRLLVSILVPGFFVTVVLFVRSASSQGSPPSLSDDFNDNALDTAKWNPNSLFSGYIDLNIPISETGQLAGDGYLYRGRGYVQITGRTNYTYFSNRLGVDLVSNPTLATDPAIAGQITVIGMQDGTFTGKRLDDFINDQKTDFFGARAVINGDKFVNGTKIENHAKNYLKALVNCNYRSGVPGRGRP